MNFISVPETYNLHMFVNLLRFTVLLEKTSQHTHPSHPVDFFRHTSVSCTLPLTCENLNRLN